MADDSSQNKVIIGKLRSDLKIFPGGADPSGHETWSIFDPVSDRYSRMDSNDYKLLTLLDREQPLDALLERVKDAGGNADRAVVMKEIFFLESSNLFVKGYGSDAKIAKNAETIKDKILKNRLLNSYLFLNIPILKPDPFFEKTMPFVKKIFNKWTMFLIGLISLSGYISLLPQTERLGSIFWNSFQIEGMLGYLLAIFALKIVHEAAHAYCAKFEGVRVRKMGIAFIVFLPRFYTDITDAWRLPDRKKRCIIDAAGILSEIIIGGFAAIIWNNTQPGVLNTIAYSFFTVSIITTIFINGNPFIRYDGYFLLMDIVNIDNLYMRGIESVRVFCHKKFLGIKNVQKNFLNELPGWRYYFIGIYAVASFLYRIFLYASIIMIVYLKFTKALGIMLFALEAWLLIIKPLVNEIRMVSKSKKSFDEKNIKGSSIAVIVLIALFFFPLPWDIELPCEILPIEHQFVYAKSPGFLKAIKVQDGGPVKAGADLFLLENPYLAWDGKTKEFDIAMQEIYLDYVRSDKKQLEYAKLELKRLELLNNSLTENLRQRSLLNIKSVIDGSFVLADRRLYPGKWINEGEFLGEVFCPEKQVITAYADESVVGKLKTGRRATLNLDGTLGKYYGTVVAVNPAPVKIPEMNSPILDIYGGPLSTTRSVEGSTLSFVFPMYIVHIMPDKGVLIPAGRSGEIHISEYTSIGMNVIKKIMNLFRKEIAF